MYSEFQTSGRECDWRVKGWPSALTGSSATQQSFADPSGKTVRWIHGRMQNVPDGSGPMNGLPAA